MALEFATIAKQIEWLIKIPLQTYRDSLFIPFYVSCMCYIQYLYTLILESPPSEPLEYHLAI
jgi:hypothetical protein